MINTSQREDQTGVLDLDRSHRPQHPHPLHILDISEIGECKCVSNDVDSLRETNVIVNLIGRTIRPSLIYDITKIGPLCDAIRPYTTDKFAL